MKNRSSQSKIRMIGLAVIGISALLQEVMAETSSNMFKWSTVVNNNDYMPIDNCNNCRTFNSYNQPSVNQKGLVVVRARSRGGPPLGPATHGIYTRDMSKTNSPIVKILDRNTEVPQPNNAHYPPSNALMTQFIETPSFPRIDMMSDTVATRGNHQPVWKYLLNDGSETRAGTTGIYTNPFGDLISGASKLGAVPVFDFFAVPGVEPPIPFDVFPGAPSVTMGSIIVFKGNYTVDKIGRTGVFFRDLKDKSIPSSEGSLIPAAGTKPVVLIANNTETLIPGTNKIFGSTSPPSAAGPKVVFAGFDNEANPTLGGIYLAPLAQNPRLRTIASIGEQVPGESGATFNNLGESNAFDGRYVGFWGAWETETKTVRLYCPTEGNQDRIAYCNQNLICDDDGRHEGDPNSVCDDTTDQNYGVSCYQDKEVPVHQGIFVNDTVRGDTHEVATTDSQLFDEFLFWNYSGKTPCTGSGHSEEGAEDDGEPARWRSSAFVAVAENKYQTYYAAFKAKKDDVVGIYLGMGPDQTIETVLDTTMAGEMLDPEVPSGSTITELGLEREGLRGDWLAVSAKIGIEGESEEEGMAGIYLTRVPNPSRRK